MTDAAIKLHGASSWDQTVMFDGARAKMQFDVSFDQINPNGKFHGVTKLVFDMPRSDWTFLHDRVSGHWLRQVGILAPCSVSGRLEINGAYYGLYAVEQGVGNDVVRQFFPSMPRAISGRAGTQAETNQKSPDYGRLTTFQTARIWRARRHRRPSGLGDVLGGRGAAEQRRRLLRRLAQFLHLRSGSGRLRLSAQ